VLVTRRVISLEKAWGREFQTGDRSRFDVEVEDIL